MNARQLVVMLGLGCGRGDEHEKAPLVPRIVTTTKMLHFETGKAFGRESECDGFHPVDTYVEQVVPSFRIDERPVTCEEWDACIAAGACKAAIGDRCNAGRAVVSWKSAAAYCTARGAQLPLWPQWMRAARGAEKHLPAPLVASCGDVFDPRQDEPCPVETALGFKFTLNNPNEGEWTRELDCYSPSEKTPVGVGLNTTLFGGYTFRARGHEFRCVLDASQTPVNSAK